jgi:hypothetical protein
MSYKIIVARYNEDINWLKMEIDNCIIYNKGNKLGLTNETRIDEIGLGNVDNTSDANKPISTATQTALNAKQATLVSGTNIKTINGSSVLGSGDLVVSGGGGLQGVHAIRPLQSGQKIFAGVTSPALSSTNTAVNRLYSAPFIPNQNIRTSDLYMNVSSTTGGNARILIYSDLDGLPDQKLYESATLDCSTTGIKIAITTFDFIAGTTYWLGFHTSASFTASFIQSTACFPLSIPVVSNPNFSVFTSAAFGSAPTTFGPPTFSQIPVPFIGITKA